MINYIKGLILLIVVASNSSALACKPGGLQEYIEFEENNSEIGATKARNLALWFIDWRDIRGISYVTVFSNSKKMMKRQKGSPMNGLRKFPLYSAHWLEIA